MKNALICFAVLSIVGCSKDQDLVQVADDLSFNSEFVRIEKVHRIYFDYGGSPGLEGVDYGCRDRGGSCLDDVPVANNHLRSVLDQMSNSVIMENSAMALQTLRDNRTEFEDYIPAAYITATLNGDLIMDVRGSFTSGNRYLLFRNKYSTVVELVVPFKN